MIFRKIGRAAGKSDSIWEKHVEEVLDRKTKITERIIGRMMSSGQHSTDYSDLKATFDGMGIDYLTDAWTASPLTSYAHYDIPKSLAPQIAMKIQIGDDTMFLFDFDLRFVGLVLPFTDADGVTSYYFDPRNR